MCFVRGDESGPHRFTQKTTTDLRIGATSHSSNGDLKKSRNKTVPTRKHGDLVAQLIDQPCNVAYWPFCDLR
jgi:hypothetical protein